MTDSACGAKRPGLLRRTYDWVLGLAETPYAVPALAALAFAESSCFPIPPDVLLLALCLGLPRRSFRYALITSVFSVLGGIGGYGIGWAAEPVGRWIITHLASARAFDQVAVWYGEDAFFYILLAAFTPIPYKVFTIAAGIFHESVPLTTLVLASIVGRSARFYLVAALVYRFGPPVRVFIERHFDRLMWTFLVLIVLGFAAIKYLGGGERLEAQDSLERLASPSAAVRAVRIERIEEEAGREFGFDARLPPGDARNEAALRAIEAWFAERDARQR
ncbi:MAG: DedA family protein [Planctomycetes bacterium]|nr:DedA family protein [Planctomycetota bacterium]